jgi:hypothetical protein
MMNYRTVKAAMVTLLGEEAESRFQVVGFQRETKSADEFLDNNKTVQVYYIEGSFPKGAAAVRGYKQHDITLNIDMSASAAAEADLTVLDSSTATPEQKAAALLAVREAAELADIALDELIDAVYAIIEDARNTDLGLGIGVIANPWIDTIKKNTTLERGDLVVKTANMRYTCRVEETVLDDIGNEPDPAVFNTTVKAGDTEGAGVIVENENTED